MHTLLFATDPLLLRSKRALLLTEQKCILLFLLPTPLLLRSKRALLLTEQNAYSSFCYRPFAPTEQESVAPNGAKMHTPLFATDPFAPTEQESVAPNGAKYKLLFLLPTLCS